MAEGVCSTVEDALNKLNLKHYCCRRFFITIVSDPLGDVRERPAFPGLEFRHERDPSLPPTWYSTH